MGGGRCPVVDTWWQTETGMILITPLPGITTLKPGSATRPFPGVAAEILNEQGKPVGPSEGGYLVLTKPWPAMLRGIYRDPDRYVKGRRCARIGDGRDTKAARGEKDRGPGEAGADPVYR